MSGRLKASKAIASGPSRTDLPVRLRSACAGLQQSTHERYERRAGEKTCPPLFFKVPSRIVSYAEMYASAAPVDNAASAAADHMI
jgi:hypothetical protein